MRYSSVDGQPDVLSGVLGWMKCFHRSGDVMIKTHRYEVASAS